jgi:hypothetical protein
MCQIMFVGDKLSLEIGNNRWSVDFIETAGSLGEAIRIHGEFLAADENYRHL